MSSKAITLQDVSKSFKQYAKPSDRLKQIFLGKHHCLYQEFHALDTVSFEIDHGQVVGIVGQNGAGKSTLLQLICGTLQPSSGTVAVNGRIAALLELGSGFNPEFSGRDNVFLNASILGLSQSEIEAKYDSIVAFSGIGDFIDQPVKTYSSGMMVRLAFSVATSVEPDILIIDEALSVGDGAFARKSFERIMALKAKGTTILFCSHNLYQIEALCDSALWLNRGKLMQRGLPSQVVKAYESALYSVSQQDDSMNTEPLPSESNRPNSATLPRLLEVLAKLGEDAADLVQTPVGKTCQTNLSIRAKWDFGTETEVVFAATVHAADGRMVGSASSLIDGHILSKHQNLDHCELTFEALPLLKGEYWVEVYLLCNQGIQFFDQRVPMARFFIEQPQESLEQGLVHLQRSWSV